MRTVDTLKGSKLHPDEVQIVREAADALFFCEDLDGDPTAQQALSAFHAFSRAHAWCRRQRIDSPPRSRSADRSRRSAKPSLGKLRSEPEGLLRRVKSCFRGRPAGAWSAR